jgi:hypothetical protein
MKMKLMKLFLTNKKKSIPIVIVVDKEREVFWENGAQDPSTLI